MTHDAPTTDRNAEMATMAACLVSKPARVEARKSLGGNDFLDPQLEVIWDVLGDLDRDGRQVDPAVVMSALGATPAARLLPDLVTWPTVPEHVSEYARVVRGWAVKRRLFTEAVRVQQIALNPDSDPGNLTAEIANRFASLRDVGLTDDVESITVGELLSEPDDEPEWVIPGLFERGDRFMLTGEEGLGKSYLLRQVAIMAAAGLDPFDPGRRIQPRRVLVVDCENSQRQVKRKIRPVVEFARRYGTGNPDFVNLLCSSRMDITRDKDLARIVREIDVIDPEILVIGPLYRLCRGALQTDDDAAPVLAALDTLRERGAVLLIEAHAGHSIGKGNVRDLRPRGSSALLGWPEFGYGLRAVANGYADVVPWRGDRDERQFPSRIRIASDGFRWIPVEASPIPEESWA